MVQALSSKKSGLVEQAVQNIVYVAHSFCSENHDISLWLQCVSGVERGGCHCEVARARSSSLGSDNFQVQQRIYCMASLTWPRHGRWDLKTPRVCVLLRRFDKPHASAFRLFQSCPCRTLFRSAARLHEAFCLRWCVHDNAKQHNYME